MHAVGPVSPSDPQVAPADTDIRDAFHFQGLKLQEFTLEPGTRSAPAEPDDGTVALRALTGPVFAADPWLPGRRPPGVHGCTGCRS